MQDELDNTQECYSSLAHEVWCDLLYIIKVKDNRKREANQIKRLATSKAASHSKRNESIRLPLKKKAMTGVITNRKQKGENKPKHHRI